MPEDFSLDDFMGRKSSSPPGSGDTFSLDAFTGDKTLSAPPPPPEKGWYEKLHDATTFNTGWGVDPKNQPKINLLDAAGELMGMLKKPVDYAARTGARAMGLPVGDEATTGSIAQAAIAPSTPSAPTPFLSPLNLMSGGVPTALEGVDNPYITAAVGEGVEKGTNFLTDPAMLAFGAGELPKAAHVGMQGMMGLGVAQQATALAEEINKKGLTPKAVKTAIGMGADGMMMILPHLSKERKAEVQKLITPPPEAAPQEIDPAQIKMIDKLTKAQDVEEIQRQRGATKAGNASDKEYARRVDKLSDVQNREEISKQKEMSKPPIPLEPLFPEGEIAPEEVKLSDTLQKEQERYPEEERFKEAREKVKELEGENPNEINPPPSEEYLPIELRPSIQEAVQGFTPKTSIKNLQERLGLDETQARDVYWRTKKALAGEKEGGNLPLDQFKDIPFEVSSDLAPHITNEAAQKLMENPHLQKLNRFIENVFPAAKDAAKNTLLDATESVEKNRYSGLALKQGSGGYRRGYSTKLPGEHPTTGEIQMNPWALVREAAWKEETGQIPKGSAPQEFARHLQEVLGHENAHAHAPHWKPKPGEVVDPDVYNPDKLNTDFSFQTADQAVRNSPEFNKAFEGMTHPRNTKALKEMYEGILKDAQGTAQDIANAKVGRKTYSGMEQNAPIEGPPENETPGFPSYEGAEYSGLTLDDIKPSYLGGKEEPLVDINDLHNPGGEQNMALKAPPPSPQGGPRLGGPRTPPPPSNPTARLGGHKPSSPQGQALSVTQPPGLAAKVWDYAKKGISAGRALTVGGDVSSPFRQSWIQTFSHPIKSAKNISMMVKHLSESGYAETSNDIRQNPYFKDAVDAKLSLTKGLIENKPEEQFEGTKVIEDIMKATHTGALNIFSPTERAYTQYLNQTRMESFQRGMELLEGKHGKRSIPEASKRALAKYVNSSTGRGEFNSKKFEAASETLNQVLFSPRLLKSRLDVFNPMEWKRMAKTEPVVAKMAATELAKSAAFVGSMVAAASAAGAKVEKDPRSPDFGKIRVGNHTIDPWGGYQQYIRYGAQFIMGKRKNQYGQVKEANRGDTLEQFGRSKLAPVPGFLLSAAKGKNLIGRRTSLTNPLSYVEAFAPMTFRDIYELGKTDPVLAVAMALPVTLGMGVVSREPLPASKKVREEFSRLLVPPPSDTQTVQLRNKPKTFDSLTGKSKYESRGLTDKEFEKAKEEGDKMAYGEIEKFISSPSYQKLSEDEKRIALNNVSRKLGGAKRKKAAELVMNPLP